MIQSLEEYMESKRKTAHELADDDHWFTTTTDSLSMYPSSIPWYVSEKSCGSRETLTVI